MKIPFNKPYLTGREIHYIADAHSRGQLAGDGHYTKMCNHWLEKNTNCKKALLTHSCTAALEMCAILVDLKPGDEVIMPSYTFVSTANAFVMRGAVPVFVDIRPDTLNINEKLIENAITHKTKAIVPVHYAGVACEMDTIMAIADKYNLLVIEDAAQGVMSSYKGRPLGSIGHLGCYSFHETKNIISGEGGALIINDLSLSERAEVIREKGTNRSKFFRGQVDKYTWVDIGSSYLPGEIIAAFLWAQIQEAEDITETRANLWLRYHEAFEKSEQDRLVIRPTIPDACQHNAHMYYLLLRSLEERSEFIRWMKEKDIQCVFHYVPLHKTKQGYKCGRFVGDLPVTKDFSNRLVRLPLWVGLEESLDIVIGEVLNFFQ
ncbi:dTDP-4-amino-4,6-dideoxygalactose transaminase [Legionella impletisoli]|uniref:dTDP-4-amino-4,6-dideoxy-D-glucose transaminase n=1 Tax=Legionella impletisoli TaxID=343510 RepID=A0A917NBX4_9GAMM|nr:dTDP-4-amino-4,6-dideoxygalactose transaminase [Legionella impletisoli]GGI82033.1 dTDP-4-amino-4,6-dideoxy-D-glucose transaminase [Legionella impletisoli]